MGMNVPLRTGFSESHSDVRENQPVQFKENEIVGHLGNSILFQ